jgi:tyrosine-protein kinase
MLVIFKFADTPKMRFFQSVSRKFNALHHKQLFDLILLDESTKIHGLESLIEHYINTKGVLSEALSLTIPVRGDPPPDNSRRHGRTNLLHRATSQGNYTIVSELLKTGYRHEAKNQNGQTAVHLASMNGKDDILRKLIEYGAGVNLRDTAGYTPLHVRLPRRISNFHRHSIFSMLAKITILVL